MVCQNGVGFVGCIKVSTTSYKLSFFKITLSYMLIQSSAFGLFLGHLSLFLLLSGFSLSPQP